MSDINLSIALDLNAIKYSGKLTTTIDDAEDRIINSEYIHMLDLRGSSFKDNGGGSADIYNVKVGDSINWSLADYSSYNSTLSAMMISYAAVDNSSKDYITPPRIVTNRLDKPHYTENFDIDFSKVDIYYWTCNVLRTNVTENYKGLIRVYEKNQPLGYAYIKRSITLNP
ncbi:inclusion body family protein [Xenorhabdus bovienii]|uniref:inclusion body family protein n=1 Tax=Xenorhabdus bovienii TaxID=40576 RepID=UPI001EDD7F70|nr:inclusion body family protein [Xenorhabdus bovienii]MCG3471450.1 inclusion body family protein [Xenorhabdus bovienii]